MNRCEAQPGKTISPSAYLFPITPKMESPINSNKPTKTRPMTPHLPKKIPVASRLSALLLIIAALFGGLFTASADITPYSWQRFTTLKSPGLDATGNNHPIAGGFTGNGESPFGTMPIDGNISVGGPLGTEGYFSSFAIRSRANAGGNQGCVFQEPTPVSGATYALATKTNENAWVLERRILDYRPRSRENGSRSC